MPISRPRKLPVTSIEVARRAGVSQSAVSLVFGGKASGRVSPKTQRTILRAARDLKYQPNLSAQVLKSGKSRLLLLAVPDIDNPYFAGALKGAEQEARKRGYSAALATVKEEGDWQPVILDSLSRSVEGFLLFAMSPPTTKHRTALKGRAVLVDTAAADFPSIELDIPQGVRCALAHLFEVGHKKIAHLAANIPLETFNSRREAYLAALSDAGLPARPDYLINSAFSIEAAQQAATHLLTCRPKPTAIFCDSDVLAVGVYKAARKLGLNIPADLSVVGFDNSMIATIVEPELTTVAVPVESVGQAAIQLLLKAITGAGARATSRIPLTLVVRGSTAMPAADRTGRHAKRLHA